MRPLRFGGERWEAPDRKIKRAYFSTGWLKQSRQPMQGGVELGERARSNEKRKKRTIVEEGATKRPRVYGSSWKGVTVTFPPFSDRKTHV